MKRQARLIIPVLILLVIMSVLGYMYRGRIRITMLDILHSFDDADLEEAEGDNEIILPPGKWGIARDSRPDTHTTQQNQEQLEQLRSLGYLSGYEEAPLEMNVTIYDQEFASDGYNVLISGHGPGVSMMDMDGNIVHEWFMEIDVYELWPDIQRRVTDWVNWRRAYLFENGDLLVIINGEGVIKIDRESNLLWTSEWICAHHDLDVDDDGNIYVIGRSTHFNERYSPDNIITEDYLYILDSLGNTIDRISIPDLIIESPYAPTLRRSDSFIGLDERGDITHCNTVAYIREGQLPDDYDGPFRKGTVLLSMRSIDLVCAVDLDDRSIYWGESDFWYKQHEPVLLSNGNMLIFDNQGVVNASSVLEFDQEIKEVEWFYRGDDENQFNSFIIGSCQRLPNGNTLITESTFGRAFELTPEKEIAWEYYNPYRAGEGMELIATLFEVFRVSEDYVDSWLLIE